MLDRLWTIVALEFRVFNFFRYRGTFQTDSAPIMHKLLMIQSFSPRPVVYLSLSNYYLFRKISSWDGFTPRFRRSQIHRQSRFNPLWRLELNLLTRQSLSKLVLIIATTFKSVRTNSESLRRTSLSLIMLPYFQSKLFLIETHISCVLCVKL